MKEIKDLHLAFSCPENKDTLQKKGKNYHCDKCKCAVLDLTNKSNEQFNEALNQSDRPVCGIFKRKQLSNQFIKYAAASFMAGTSIAFQTHAQDIKIDSIYETCEHQHDGYAEVFGMVAEKMAAPVDGYGEFMKAIYKELQLPNGLVEKGKVFVHFTVDTVGEIGEVKIVKSYNDLAAKEAKRVIEIINYPFTPASQRGMKVKSQLIVPVVFDPERKD